MQPDTGRVAGNSGRDRNILDSLAWSVATTLGLGLIPVGPGTFGSLAGLLIAAFIVYVFRFSPDLMWQVILGAATLVFIIGVWAASRVERLLGKKDAQIIVIDEVCGQLLTFVLLAPLMGRIGGGWRWAMVAGFLLFRGFDIFKPFPIRRLEKIRSGAGVMADDVGAGIYAAVVLWAVFFFLY